MLGYPRNVCKIVLKCWLVLWQPRKMDVLGYPRNVCKIVLKCWLVLWQPRKMGVLGWNVVKFRPIGQRNQACVYTQLMEILR